MIIGLLGPSGSGKSKVAKRFVKKHAFTKIHAGAPVKKAMRAGFGMDKASVGGDDEIDSPHRALGGVAPRAVMDPVSEAVHKHAPLATAIQLGRKLDMHTAQGHDVVVDGVRSQHEADAIHKRGGTIVRIKRPGVDADPQLAMDKMQDGIKADDTINHPGDVPDKKEKLHAEVDKVFYKLMRP